MAALDRRLERARAVADHPRIVVTDIERKLGTQYTADTLKALIQRFPGVFFVWIMGADNLIGFTRWKRWTEIVETVPIAVIDRPGYSLRAMASPIAERYARHRVPSRSAGALATMKPPAWALLRERLHPASATAIRLAEARRSA
jgi:nicotinate-nucleotide adenylyltransferase